MNSPSIYRQLVLFDCDDGRLSLFKDHDKYLSRIPSNCEWYIFWNDLKLPVYKKFKWILRKYSHIHLCPSYSEQMDDSCTSNSDLLFYLNKLVYKFSSILLVHGHDQSYGKSVERVTKQYGNGKMELKVINKPFSRHLPRILTRLQKKDRQYKHHEYLKNLSSKNLLKHEGRSFVSNGIWNYDSNPIPYALEENINFKRIIKRKQKNLKIYFNNIGLCGTMQFSAHFDDNNEYEQDNDCLSTVYKPIQSLVLKINLQQMFSLLLQRRKGFKYTFTVTRHFDGKPAEFIRSNVIQPSIHFEYQKSMTQEKVYSRKPSINLLKYTATLFQGPEKMKSSISNNRQTKITLVDTRTSNFHRSQKMVKQEYIQKAEMTNNPKSEPSYCSQCSKKFRCIGSLEQHFHAKHVQPSFYYTTNQTYSFDKHIAVMQEENNTAKNANFAINSQFFWSQLSEKVKSITRSDVGPTVEHTKPVSFAYAKSSCDNDQSSITIQEQVKINQHTTSSTKAIFSCWQCPAKLKTARIRLNHFIKTHFASFLPTISLSKSCDCWECGKEFKSHNGRISHFIDQHARTILLTNTDPSSALRNQITMAQKRMKATIGTTIATNASFNCSQRSRKFKYADARINDCNTKHTGSSVSTDTPPLNHPKIHTRIIYNRIKYTKHTIDFMKSIFDRSQYPETFEVAATRADKKVEKRV